VNNEFFAMNATWRTDYRFKHLLQLPENLPAATEKAGLYAYAELKASDVNIE
jgi:hypothetical protein